jgi:flagellar biosynthesis/type III secretory pathway M-ring protein FliF/YscJ
MTSGSWTWLLIDVVFVVILGAAIVYGVMMTRRRRRDRGAEARRDEATRELYDKRARPQMPPD